MDNSMEIARWEEDLSWASADVRGGAASGLLRAAVRQGHAAHGFVSTLLMQQLHAESELARQTAELAAARSGELARLRNSARECISWTAPFDSAALTGLVRRYIGLLRELRGCVDVTATEAGALLDPENAPTLASINAGARLGRTASSGIPVGELDASALTDALGDFDQAVRSIAVARGDLIRQHAGEQKASAAALATTIAGTMASRVEALVNKHVADNAARVPEAAIRGIVTDVADALKQARPVADMTLALCCTGDDAETQGTAAIVRDAPERVLLSLRRFNAPPPPPPPRPSAPPRGSEGPESGRPSSVASPTSRQHLRDAGQAYRADIGDSRRRPRAEVVDVDAAAPSSPLSFQGNSGQQQARRQPQPPTPLSGQGRTSGAHATAAVRMSSGRPSGQAGARPSGQQPQPAAHPRPAADDDDTEPSAPKRHNLFNLFGIL
jgi:hypothetical protein